MLGPYIHVRKPGGLSSAASKKAVAAGQLGVAGQLQVLHYTDEAEIGAVCGGISRLSIFQFSCT